jgi:hypothetical protein
VAKTSWLLIQSHVEDPLNRGTRATTAPISSDQLLQPSRSSCSSHFCTTVFPTSSQPRIPIPILNYQSLSHPARLPPLHLAPSTAATFRAIPLCFAFVVVELLDFNTTPPRPPTVPTTTITTTTTPRHVAILQLRCPAAPPPAPQRPHAQPPRRPIAEGAPDLGSAPQQAVPPSPHPQGIQRRAPHPHRLQARLRGRQVIRH